MPYVNLKGEPLSMADLMAEGMRQRAIERGLGISHRKPTVKNGYAAPPGTGPEGMTCKTCKHKRSMESQGGTKRWIKCELRRATWTNGPGSDILAKSPACNKFEEREHGN